jgi:general stress protein YciG
MELKEYHYVYYSYEEYGRGYFGSRTCRCLPEEDVRYFGSFRDKTFNPTQKIILKSDYDTRAEADADEILLHDYFEVDINPHFTNRSRQTSTKFRLPRERAIEIGKCSSKKGKELGVGIFGMTKEELSKAGKKGGKIIGAKNKENKIGYMGRTKEQMTENGKKGGKRCYELGLGVHGLTFEERSNNSKKSVKKTNSQKWMCLETGYITNAGALSKYQKARNIDTSKRVRVS